MVTRHGRIDRREFLFQGSAGLVGLTLLSGCERNLVEPITSGMEVPFITPVGSFYVKVGAEISIGNWRQPIISQEAWSLSIDGLVDRPLTIRYADLEAEAQLGNSVSVLKTMRCVIDSNEIAGLIGTALWTGVPLSIFTERAGIKAEAVRCRVFGADGFRNNFRVSRLVDNPAAQSYAPLLVTHMNGELLPEIHGGPVRLLLNESFGYKNIKWLERLTVTDRDDAFGTYQDAGFVDDGEIRVVSRVTDPIGNAVVPAGSMQMTGFAVSGAGPISAVEVSLDGGSWMAASPVPFAEIMQDHPLTGSARQVLDGITYPFRSVWLTWRANLSLSRGEHEIRVRATDSRGNTQPAADTSIADSINAVPIIRVQAV